MTDLRLSKDSRIRRRVLIGTLSNYIGQLVALGSLFLLTPFILRQLGDVTYGLWVLTGSVVAYGGLLDFGIWGTLIKYIAEYRARGEELKAQSLVATSMWLYSLIGLIVLLATAAAAPVFPLLFQLPEGQQKLAGQLFLLMGLGVGIAIPGMAPMAILRGLQRYDIVNLIDVLATIYTALATAAALIFGAGVLGLVSANLTGMLLTAVLGAWFVRRTAPEIGLGWRGADRRLIPMIFSFSWPLFAKEVSGRLQTKTDEITISVFLPIRFLPPYNLARRLSELTQVLSKQFIKVLLPLASELHAENDLPRLRSLFITGTRLTLSISLAIGCTLMVLARPILTAWVGDEYASGAPLVVILTTASLFATSLWPAGVVLQGLARHRVLAITSFGSGIANLIISILLIRPFGLVGVAFGTLIPSLIEFFIVFPFTLKLVQVRGSEAMKEILIPALSPALLMVLTLITLFRASDPSSILSIGLIAATGLLVFSASYLSMGANKIERQTCRGFVFHFFTFARAYFKRAG